MCLISMTTVRWTSSTGDRNTVNIVVDFRRKKKERTHRKLISDQIYTCDV